MPPRKRKKKAAAAKKEEGEEEPVEAEAEEPAAKKQETEAGEAGEEAAGAGTRSVVVGARARRAAAARRRGREPARVGPKRSARSRRGRGRAAAVVVVSAPPQPSYHAQLAQARAAPQASSYYPQQVQVAGLTGRRHQPHQAICGRPEHGHVQGRLTGVLRPLQRRPRRGDPEAPDDEALSRAVWKSNFGRPTPSPRCWLRSCVCSMAWSFQAVDADVVPVAASARWRFTKVHAIFLRIT